MPITPYTFTYTPDNGAALTEKPRVLSSSFGDGYNQRVGDGINIRPRSWVLTFNTRTDAEISPILSFLRARNGIDAFSWTDPNGYTGTYTCEEWTHTVVRTGINNLSCTFVERFGV